MKNTNNKDLDLLLLASKPTECECGGKYFHIGGGKYKCQKCETVILDDFGKIKAFLDENGATPIVAISQATGVSVDVIEALLKDGQVEISDNSKYFIKCQKCGCSIKSGRFCFECARELSGDIQKIFFNEMGEKPKTELKGKMHYLNKRDSYK